MKNQSIVVVSVILLALLSTSLAEQEGRCEGCGYGGTAIIDDQLVIRYDNQWRSVCSNNFNDVDAEVACKSIFGSKSAVLQWKANQQCNIDNFWLDNVECNGEEDNLIICNHDGIGHSDCSSDQCTLLACSRPEEPSELKHRLQLGILEVQYFGEWRYVCDESFEQLDANVACKAINGPSFVATDFRKAQLCDGLPAVDFWLSDLDCTGQENNLANCGGYKGFGYHNCEETQCIRLSCEEQEEVPITQLLHGETGILAIFHNEEIKNVCDHGFGEANAAVACTDLYGNPAFYYYEQMHDCDYEGFWLDDVACQGNEANIEDCKHKDWGVHNCANDECVLLYCVGGGPTPEPVPVEPVIELIQDPETGVINIKHDGEIKAVCDNEFDDFAAEVVCWELYENVEVIDYFVGQECHYQDFWLDNIMCIGEEERIAECDHTGWGQHDCNPKRQCVIVYCKAGGPQPAKKPTPVPPTPKTPAQSIGIVVPQMHLRQNPEGILYINYIEQNKGLCDTKFNQKSAEVACLELQGSAEVVEFHTGKKCNFVDFWLDEVVCTGSEPNIQDCEHLGAGNHNCAANSNNCVQLFCAGGGPQPADEHLIHSEEGIISILHEEEIRNICDNKFEDNVASTICLSLYGNPEVLSFEVNQDCKLEGFWLDNVVCEVVELKLQNCQHNDWGTHDCGKDQCVRIFCEGGGPQPDEEEKPGIIQHNPTTGILSYTYGEEPRAICDDGFGQVEAETACFQLYGSRDVSGFSTGQPCDYENFWLDDVQCNENSQKMKDCEHLPWGQHNCDWQNNCIELFCCDGGPQIINSVKLVDLENPEIICDNSNIYVIDGVKVCIYGPIYPVPASKGQPECQAENTRIIDGEKKCLPGVIDIDEPISNPEACNPGVYKVVGSKQTCTKGPLTVIDIKEPIDPVCNADNIIIIGNLRVCINGPVTSTPCTAGQQEQLIDGTVQCIPGKVDPVEPPQEPSCEHVQVVNGKKYCVQGPIIIIDKVDCEPQSIRLVDGKHVCKHSSLKIVRELQQPDEIEVDCDETNTYTIDGVIVCINAPIIPITEDQDPQCQQSSVKVINGQRKCIPGTIDIVPEGQEPTCSQEELTVLKGQRICTTGNVKVLDIECQGSLKIVNGKQVCIPGSITIIDNEDVIVCNSLNTKVIDGVKVCIWGPIVPVQEGEEPSCEEDSLKVIDEKIVCIPGTVDVNEPVEDPETCQEGVYKSFDNKSTCSTGQVTVIDVADPEVECDEGNIGVVNGYVVCVTVPVVPVPPESEPSCNKNKQIMINGQNNCIPDGTVDPIPSPNPAPCEGKQLKIINGQKICVSGPVIIIDQAECETGSLKIISGKIACVPSSLKLVDDVEPEQECEGGSLKIVEGKQICVPDSIKIIESDETCDTASIEIVEIPVEYTLTHRLDGLIGITYEGENRGVCQDGFDESSAQVVCQQLYGVDFAKFEIGKICKHEQFWLDDVSCRGDEAHILDCEHAELGVHDCDHRRECVHVYCKGAGPQFPGVVIGQDDDGIIVIDKDNEVKELCDHDVNQMTAEIICRELFGVGHVALETGVQCKKNDFWLDNVKCNGSERRLIECKHSEWGVHNCETTNCVRVQCAQKEGWQPEKSEPAVLVHNQTSGVLSITYQEITQGVCDDGFNDKSAEVACFELYEDNEVILWKAGAKCDHTNFWIDDVECTGEEKTLHECQHQTWGIHNCDYTQQCVELYCVAGGPVVPPPPPSPPVIKIGILKHHITGIISITYDQSDKAVCDRGWDDANSVVACNELYGAGVVSWSIGHKCEYSDFWLDSVNCVSNEKRMNDCDHRAWGTHNCDKNNNCVQLWCESGPQPETAHVVHHSDGIISVLHKGQTKNIGDKDFTDTAAQTVCNELYGSPSVKFYQRGKGCHYDEFWVDQIICGEIEEEMQRCNHQDWGIAQRDATNSCIRLCCAGHGPQIPEDDGEDGETIDVDDETESEVDLGKLVHNEKTGILSYEYDQTQKAFCDDNFSDENAEVACFELYGDAEVISWSTGHTCDHREFWLDEVDCFGDEEIIADCDHLAFGTHNCQWQRECVELFCVAGGPQKKKPSVKPEVEVPEEIEEEKGHTSINQQGILSFTYEGKSKHVCQNGFNDHSANVACHELYGEHSVPIRWAPEKECKNTYFWLDDLNCDGEEEGLGDCEHAPYGEHNCNEKSCVQLICEGGVEPNTAPLIHSNNGILNVLYNDEIKGVCHDGFSEMNAKTACMELYKHAEVTEFKINQECDRKGYWLDDVVCEQVESKLTKCEHSAFGTGSCDEVGCVYLRCAAQGPEPSDEPVTPPPVDIFLVHNQETGVVSISHGGTIKAVCDDEWQSVNSEIACNQLYGSNKVISWEGGHQCDYSSFWLDKVNCKGGEHRIKDCDHNDWGVSDCNPQTECIQLYCGGGGPHPEEGKVIQNPETGVISIIYDDEAKSLCHDTFTAENAKVICRELYDNEKVQGYFTNQACDYQDFWLDDVVCSGKEKLLDSCKHSAYGEHNCNYRHQCVRVFCVGGGPSLPKASLVHSQTGLLGIDYDSTIKHLADTGFNDQAARTSCFELYQHPNFMLYRTGEACQIEGFWIDNIKCNSHNVQIDECEHNDYGVTLASTNQNSCVLLYCEAGGPSPPRGHLIHNLETAIVSIRYLGTEKGLCDNGFNDNGARVACKELYGVPDFIKYKSGKACDHEEIWLSNVDCQGNENTVTDCPHSKWGQHNCKFENECIELYCQGGGPQPFEPGTLSHSQNAILSMTYEGETKGFADKVFNELSAQVACMELYANPTFKSFSIGHRCEYQAFWAERAICQGNEATMFECQRVGLDIQNLNTETNCVQLYCAEGPQQEVVIIKHDGETGIVIIDRNGEQRALCDDGFTLKSAEVFCKLMYEDPSVISFSHGHNCGALPDFWLNRVECRGDELTLVDCPHDPWGQHSCNLKNECVQVYCANGGIQPPAHITQSSLGILSITYDGVSKALCDNHFNDQAAMVACKEMFGNPEFVQYSHGHACTYQTFWIDNIICEGTETVIQDCSHSAWGESQCDPAKKCVRLYCVGGGAEPTKGRVTQSEDTGALLYNIGDDIRAVCDNQFGDKEASVACLDLTGNSGVIEYRLGFDCSADTETFWLDDVACIGNENLLGDCTHRLLEENNCNSAHECIYLVCSGGGFRPPADESTSVLGHSANGQINLVYEKNKKSICDHRFSDFSANVVCRELYGDPVFIRWLPAMVCDHQGFWLDEVDCEGPEGRLIECPHRPLGDSSCNQNECINVFCRAGGPKPAASPLVHSNTGIVSILHDSQVKSICDTEWTMTDARVACAELYSNPEVIEFETGQKCVHEQFWLDKVDCIGGEVRIVDCNFEQWGKHSCNNENNCIRLSCKGGGFQSLIPDPILNHEPEIAILSMTYKKKIRNVCDDYFGAEEARVACMELYGSPAYVQFELGHECKHENFWADDIICQGNEIKMSECEHTPWGTHNCNQNQCVQLYCVEGGPEIESEAKLSLSSENILEITYNGEKRGVCDDGFDNTNAEIACLELFGAPTVSAFSGGHRCNYKDFWLDDVNCIGTEEKITDCFKRRWGSHNCDWENQCIELICGEEAVPVIELIHDGETGIIGLSVDGAVNGICDNRFSSIDAEVICKQLYGKPEVIEYKQGETCVQGWTNFWLDGIVCEGNELSILDCTHQPFGVHNCQVTSQCVVLYCSGGGPQPPAHLIQNDQGIISITYNGESKAVCSHGWSDNAAHVACKELYGDPTFISYSVSARCAYEDQWIDKVICEGVEGKIQDCQHTPFGDASCDLNINCIQLYCTAGGPQPDVVNLIHNQETAILTVTYEEAEKGLCDNHFDARDALVCCKQLYGRQAGVISFSHGHACGVEDFWIDDLQCTGQEHAITECRHAPIGVHNCNAAHECIKLYCSQGVQPPDEEPPKLKQNDVGILHMVYYGENRAVCDKDGFNDRAAEVSCFELFGDKNFISYQLGQQCSYNNFWLDEIQCLGEEKALVGCEHRALGSHTCSHSENCIRLFCSAGGAQPPSQVVAGILIHNPDTAIISYTYNDETKSICDDGWNEYSSAVACKQLYGNPQVKKFSQAKDCEYAEFWLDDVNCNGSEEKISECSHAAWGTHNCELTECIKLYCVAGGPQPPEDSVPSDKEGEEEGEPGCAVLYSQCDFKGDTFKVCNQADMLQSQVEEGWKVMCVKIPENYTIRIFETDQSGSEVAVDIQHSIPCIQGSKSAKLVDQAQLIQSSLTKRNFQLAMKTAVKSKKSKLQSKNKNKKTLLRKNRK